MKASTLPSVLSENKKKTTKKWYKFSVFIVLLKAVFPYFQNTLTHTHTYDPNYSTHNLICIVLLIFNLLILQRNKLKQNI